MLRLPLNDDQKLVFISLAIVIILNAAILYFRSKEIDL